MRNHANLRLLAVSIFTAALITSAGADVIPPCALPNGVASVPFPDAMPSPVSQALKEHVGELVLPGGKFDATDMIVTGRSRRLIFVWNIGKRWVIATEHGGRGYNDPIVAYDLSQNGRNATLVEERIAFPPTVCATASSLLGVER